MKKKKLNHTRRQLPIHKPAIRIAKAKYMYRALAGWKIREAGLRKRSLAMKVMN
ncbi:hypothetical protein D3C76_1649440 [compost metagenome]